MAWCCVPGSGLAQADFPHEGCEGVVANNRLEGLLVHASLNGAVLLVVFRGRQGKNHYNHGMV